MALDIEGVAGCCLRRRPAMISRLPTNVRVHLDYTRRRCVNSIAPATRRLRWPRSPSAGTRSSSINSLYVILKHQKSKVFVFTKECLNMSTGARELLWQLLGYIAEQIKDIDPRGFQLSKDSGFRCAPPTFAVCPALKWTFALRVTISGCG